MISSWIHASRLEYLLGSLRGSLEAGEDLFLDSRKPARISDWIFARILARRRVSLLGSLRARFWLPSPLSHRQAPIYNEQHWKRQKTAFDWGRFPRCFLAKTKRHILMYFSLSQAEGLTPIGTALRSSSAKSRVYSDGKLPSLRYVKHTLILRSSW